MHKTQLPISALPAWCKLNDATFLDTSVQNLQGRGFGIVTERTLSSEDTFDVPNLLLIPHDLILSAEAIEEHTKVDQHFHQLLDVAGGKSLRGDILLFLLMQITIASQGHDRSVGCSSPWTEYVKMLPNYVPTPTLWSEDDISLLVGTSLESALAAKLEALAREFQDLQETTAGLVWCHKSWWENTDLKFSDWLLVDAWYRSRCLELPSSGESLVPCLDMANHSLEANAYYEETHDTGVSLILRPGVELESGVEVTISYGDLKSDAEMLFSYGFIDERSTRNELILNIESSPDDPLGKAKSAAFSAPQIVHIAQIDDKIEWDSPFLFLSLLNEEDGLEFKMQIQTDGSSGAWRVFWQDFDVTDDIATFKSLVAGHELKEIFNLRAVVMLQSRIREQLERLYESDELVSLLASSSPFKTDRQTMALKLRTSETELLEAAYSSMELQKTHLLGHEKVVYYLGQINSTTHEEDQPEPREEDDFS